MARNWQYTTVVRRVRNQAEPLDEAEAPASASRQYSGKVPIGSRTEGDGGERSGIRARLLFMDQSPAVQQLVKHAFHAAGYEVHLASTLVELESMLERLEIDLILLELNLKVGQGDDVCRRLKRKSVKQAPVVLISGVPEEELALRAEEAGADRYYSRSHGLTELVELVDQLTLELPR